MPSIDDRMRKRFILMNSDAALRQEVESSIPEKWEMTEATDLDAFDEWQEILLHRFMLLNLEDPQISDPVELIDMIRREHQLNIPIFCLGGSRELRDQARSARADRFFDREEGLQRLPEFFQQFAW
ncbi:hypothetical protein HF670_13185 [Acidithiobacillus thiooxidans]|jgi:hypothetical protein|uniref:Response regulatory domain-containing protein n=1 Tax=Acidithiobacillus thiooxidans TaxID=930 RepID=A0A1C2JD51_ACITH|nr:hypothetical protein [Acidithiobacillus thiooxidans]MBU2840482.1 hypothetical protein [Acidithiobacillus thiooxidans]OCX69336.1 hypothetical protein A6O24_18620 [Acidithiobacillus thiooxidans]OCX71300.1 hypothetical protein A6P07_12395 [Acidithiobacillus thiooxidans]OCX75720.1 hypothetical protein A6M23_01345 [Acidithiobacillus thiooxidans]OCX80747.1 hypothetical protein A6O26_14215 [Acidithiobacillus thiooxidans]